MQGPGFPLTYTQLLFSVRCPSRWGVEVPVNTMERFLHEEINRLMDRLAATMPDNRVERMRGANPTLSQRLDEIDATLAGIRTSLLEGYGRWGRALDDLENLWALAAWRSATSEETPEKPAALAA